MRHNIFPLAALVFTGVQAFGADLSFTGSFSSDDEKKQFTFALAAPANVTLRTLSYAGGVNAQGATIPRGGFDPSLSLFDSNGNLVMVNRDGGCTQVKRDLVTSYCWDSYMSLQLPAGSWTVVLTQSENLPFGPKMTDSWVYEGTGNFTADPEGEQQSGFWDFYPDHRTGSWAVDILGVSSDSPVIPPSITSVVNSASFQVAAPGPNTILTLFDKSLTAAVSSDGSAVTVTIDGKPVEVLYVGSGQINFVVPPDVTPKTGAKIQVLRGANLVVASTIDISDASPALFTQTASGTGQASVLNVSALGTTFNGAPPSAQPASCGSYLAVFGTGFGAANPADANGLSWLVQPVTATIGGAPAQVVFAGLAPTETMGLQQINVLLPDNCTTGPAVPVRLQVGNHSSQAGTTVAIQ